MKKTLIMVLGVVLMSGTAFAASISGSKHDMSTGGGQAINSGTTKLCEVCHAPHNAINAIPLWNRTNPAAATIGVYNTSATLSAHTKSIATLAAGSISLQCMSCHAATAGQAANASIMKSSSLNATVLAGTWAGTVGNGGLGTDLSNDHPIGMNYATAEGGRVAAGGTALHPLATAVTNGAVFFTNGALVNQMECASCHKVHDPGAGDFVPFLRIANTSSALCKACHTN